MTISERLQAKEDFLSTYGQGSYHALMDYLRGGLDEARDTLETATAMTDVYHAQGKVSAFKEIIRDLTPDTSKF